MVVRMYIYVLYQNIHSSSFVINDVGALDASLLRCTPSGVDHLEETPRSLVLPAN